MTPPAINSVTEVPKHVAIIGAGPAGLTAGYELAKAGVQVSIFEAGPYVGGMARSLELWGQIVDLGPHRFFSHDRRVNSLWLELAGTDYHMVNRQTRIYYKGRLFDYPLSAFNALRNLGIGEAVHCVLSYFFRARTSEAAKRNFEAWIVQNFGQRLFEIFFKSYSEKLWGVPCKDIDADFAAQRIKKFSLGQALLNLAGLGGKGHKTLVDQFAYPLEGTGMVYERMAQRIIQMGGQVYTDTPIRKVLHTDKKVYGVELANGREIRADKVISTMPLTQLVRGLGDIPPSVAAAVDALTYRNTILVYLQVDSDQLFPDQWLYVQSPELQVGRITNYHNWVPELHRGAKNSILSCEYWCNDDDSIWKEDDASIIALATREFQASSLAKGAAVTAGHVIRLPKCYPVYRTGYKAPLAQITEYLTDYQHVIPIGRYGAFKYNNQDHSIHMGILAAENLTQGTSHDLWGVNTDYDNFQEGCRITDTGLAPISQAKS